VSFLLSGQFSALMANLSDELAPVIVSVMLMMIPIVALLTSHQRKMAKIMRESDGVQDPRLAMENEYLRREMAELKALMHQQAIAIDNLAPRLAAPMDVSQRLENPLR
jgi:hypothetical protein